MTHIVYTGRHLIADRRCFQSNETSFDQTKLRSVKKEGKTLHFAFCGSYLACELGEKYIRSDGNPGVKAEIIQRLGEDASRLDSGLLVEVPDDPLEETKVYLSSYCGDLCEIPPKQFMAIGVLNEFIKVAMDTYEWLLDKEDVEWSECEPDHIVDLVRHVLRNTSYNQDGHKFDSVDTWERENVRHQTL